MRRITGCLTSIQFFLILTKSTKPGFFFHCSTIEDDAWTFFDFKSNAVTQSPCYWVLSFTLFLRNRISLPFSQRPDSFIRIDYIKSWWTTNFFRFFVCWKNSSACLQHNTQPNNRCLTLDSQRGECTLKRTSQSLCRGFP